MKRILGLNRLTENKRAILKWFANHKREMPWRLSKEPYQIWLSEIILQQTQVQQGTPYFNRFLTAYPTLKDLAAAREEQVLQLWQGLGYYSRARNLLYTAQFIQNELKGKFPDTFKDLLKLKGVGDYTAAAIASICYNEKVPVVDGNVVRVLSRLFLINENYVQAKSKDKYKKFAHLIMDENNPGDSNQAMMELGALICKPQNPKCTECPLVSICQARQNQQIHLYPPKKSKPEKVEKYMHFLVPIYQNKQTLIQKRVGSGIWKNLYTFTVYESSTPIEETDFLKFLAHAFSKLKYKIDKPLKFKHILTHRMIYAKFYIVHIEGKKDWMALKEMDIEKHFSSKESLSLTMDKQKFNRTKNCNIFEVELNNMLEHYAFPRLMTKFLELASLLE